MHSLTSPSTTPERTPGPAGPETASRYSKLSVITCIVLIWFHVQAVAAFWSFSWTNLAVALALYWLSVGLGISMGYHRLHTHRGFKTFRLFDYFLAVCGTLTLEGGPIFWVATHRLHHQHSDQPEDPHTPRVERLLGAHRLDHVRRSAPQRHGAHGALRARSREGPVLSLADHLPLGAAHRARLHAAGDRRLGARELGDLPARGGRASIRPGS